MDPTVVYKKPAIGWSSSILLGELLHSDLDETLLLLIFTLHPIVSDSLNSLFKVYKVDRGPVDSEDSSLLGCDN